MKSPIGSLLAVSLLLASLAVVSSGAQAQSWCPSVSVTVTPSFSTPNVPIPYTFLVQNTGASDLNLTSVTVRFSFESSDRALGAGHVSSGSFETFETPSITVPSSATFTIAVTLNGYPANNPSDSGACAKTLTVSGLGGGGTGGLFDVALLGIILLAVIVIVVVVVIVVVIVVVTRKKAPPVPPQGPYAQPYQQPYQPGYQQPYQPPYQPPQGPQQPPTP